MKKIWRRKINVPPYVDIEIPIKSDYFDEDDEGNKIFYNTASMTIDKILDKINKMGIPVSEYKNITCSIGYDDHYSDPFLSVVYRKKRTQEEIEEETKKQQAEIAEHQEDVRQRKLQKENKKREKQKALESLTEEQRKILGL